MENFFGFLMKDLTIKVHFWFMNYQLNQTPWYNILFFIFFGNFSLGGSTVLFFFLLVK